MSNRGSRRRTGDADGARDFVENVETVPSAVVRPWCVDPAGPVSILTSPPKALDACPRILFLPRRSHRSANDGLRLLTKTLEK
jgi:hypothetical protein